MTSDLLINETYSQLDAACDVQRGFMEHEAPAIDSLSYSARCRQVYELGGDCYDFVQLPDNRLAGAVGDASGKGVAAALMISNVQSSLRTAALCSKNDLAGILRLVNRQVHATSRSGRYATLFFGVFDPATRILQYVNAGHNPPLVIRRDGSTAWLEAGGPPVGIFPDSTYEQGSIQLDAGDVVLAYTDGVVEALSPNGEEWQVERLRQAATESGAEGADDIADGIFASMDEFSRGRQTDDATVVVMRIH